jgi:plastocyanin domain-containing protein
MFRLAVVLIAAAASFATQPRNALAQQPLEISLTIKGGKFEPAEIEVPANTPVRLKLKNLEPKPVEFESNALRFEKIVTAGSEATVNVRAQKPGRYEFFDEFREETARGTLIVK